MTPELPAASCLYSGKVQPAYGKYTGENMLRCNGSYSFTVRLEKSCYASKRCGPGIKVHIEKVNTIWCSSVYLTPLIKPGQVMTKI